MTICPGIYDLAEMKDGLLARLRLPGGRLSSSAAELIADLAKTHGNGEIDLTNRANLQLRGISRQEKEPLIKALLAHRLVSPDPDHDRRRNITIDPLSGLHLPEGGELIDCTSLAKGLDAMLQSSPLCRKLSPKFSFVLDGGGPTCISALPHDIALKAMGHKGGGALRFRLYLRGHQTPFCLPETALLGGLEALLKKLISLAEPEPLRLKSLLAHNVINELVASIAEALPDEWRLQEEGTNDQTTPPLNQLRTPLKMTDGRYCLPLISPVHGLSAAQLKGLAELNRNYAEGPMRLTPWGGIILTAVGERDIADLWARAEMLALLTQEAEQNLAIISCTGSKGCTRAGFETRHLALLIREALAEKSFAAPCTIHLSACPKGCASQQKAGILLMQRQGEAAPKLYRNAAPDTSAPGEQLAASSSNNDPKEIASAIKKMI